MATTETYRMLVQQYQNSLKRLSDLLLEIRDDAELSSEERYHLTDGVADLIWTCLLDMGDRAVAIGGSSVVAAPPIPN